MFNKFKKKNHNRFLAVTTGTTFWKPEKDRESQLI